MVNIQTTIWKDPPFSSWVNPLFRLGHFPVRYVTNDQRIYGTGNMQHPLGKSSAGWDPDFFSGCKMIYPPVVKCGNAAMIQWNIPNLNVGWLVVFRHPSEKY